MGNVYYVNMWRGGIHRYIFRYDPVPGICNYGHGGYYRSPKTFHEIKWSLADPEFIRPSRRKRNLPTVYDDVSRSNSNLTSWKHCTKKRKQWM